jgi:Rubisco LSMT substrate-binding
VAALFNTARIASLSASELSPDGLRRLHTLNHGGESEGARVQESAEKVLLTGVAEGDDFTDRLQSPWGGNSGKGAVEHVVVPRRAELQAMQSLWTALQRLRQSYPTSTSADAALLTQKPSSSARARAGNSRRHASSSSRDASSDPSNASASLTPLERSIVETRLGEMRLLDAVLQAIRSNTRQLLGSADAVAALLDGTARDDL